MKAWKLLLAGLMLMPAVVFGQTSTTTAVVSSLNPSLFGDSVRFTATVTPIGSPESVAAPSIAVTPTGTVQFKDGLGNLGPPITLSGPSVIFTTSGLAVGNHPITAVYSGDNNFPGSTSPILVQVVTAPPPVTSSITLVSSLNPSLFGQAVTFTATVTGNNPTGSVQFKDGATNLGSPVPMAAGVAAFPISTLTVGTHPITAVYSGDIGNAASTSTILNQVVNAPPPPGTSSVVLTSSLNPSPAGQAVTFTATVTGNNPTGNVQFMDGGTVIGATGLSPSAVGTQSGPKAALVGGKATLITSSLSPGTHTLTAVYSGDPNNAGSTSSPLTQTVNAVLPPVVPPLTPEATIPTLSDWALILLAALMGVIALGSARGRKRG